MCKSENQFSLVVLNSGRASGQENPLRLISSSFFLFMEVSLYLDIHEILILRARKPSITSDELALNIFFKHSYKTTRKGWQIPDLMTKSLKNLEFVLSRSLKPLIQNKGSQTRKKKRSFIMGIILIGFKQNKINVQFEVLTTIIKLDE